MGVSTFLLYRKFLKSSKIVYNGLEIKNGMTRERRLQLRHDVVYEIFCFGSVGTALSDNEERFKENGVIHIP